MYISFVDLLCMSWSINTLYMRGKCINEFLFGMYNWALKNIDEETQMNGCYKNTGCEPIVN